MKQALICCAIAFIVTAAIGPSVIRYLRKMKFGQKILEIGPKWHMNKQNIPTMGGFMFIIGIAAAVVIGGLVTGSLNVHAQQALRRGQGARNQLLHVVNLGQDAPRMLQVGLALGCQAHAAGCAVDQLHTQARFHLRQPFADGWRGHIQLACCGREAAATRQEAEKAHLRGGRQRCVHCFFEVNNRIT